MKRDKKLLVKILQSRQRHLSANTYFRYPRGTAIMIRRKVLEGSRNHRLAAKLQAQEKLETSREVGTHVLGSHRRMMNGDYCQAQTQAASQAWPLPEPAS